MLLIAGGLCRRLKPALQAEARATQAGDADFLVPLGSFRNFCHAFRPASAFLSPYSVSMIIAIEAVLQPLSCRLPASYAGFTGCDWGLVNLNLRARSSVG